MRHASNACSGRCRYNYQNSLFSQTYYLYFLHWLSHFQFTNSKITNKCWLIMGRFMVLCFMGLQHHKIVRHNTMSRHRLLAKHLLSFVRYSSCGQSSWTLSSWTVLFDDDINRYIVEKKFKFWKNSYYKWITSFNYLMKISDIVQTLMVFRAWELIG